MLDFIAVALVNKYTGKIDEERYFIPKDGLTETFIFKRDNIKVDHKIIITGFFYNLNSYGFVNVKNYEAYKFDTSNRDFLNIANLNTNTSSFMERSDQDMVVNFLRKFSFMEIASPFVVIKDATDILFSSFEKTHKVSDIIINCFIGKSLNMFDFDEKKCKFDNKLQNSFYY